MSRYKVKNKNDLSFLHKTKLQILSLEQSAESQALFLFPCVQK